LHPAESTNLNSPRLAESKILRDEYTRCPLEIEGEETCKKN
jgi:hypothetical protein